MYVVFLGPPGAGKGTQASAVAEKLGLIHLATGDLLREAVRQGAPLGQQAKLFMHRGELVPDALVLAMVMDRLSEPDTAKGGVLDGFPRNIAQAKALDDALGERGQRVDRVVYLKVAEPELVARLSLRWECQSCRAPYHQEVKPPRKPGVCDRCGGVLQQRSDDRPDTVRRRLQVYFEQTEPLLQYYRDRGVLVEVDGQGAISEVTRRIMAAIGKDGQKGP